MKHGILEESFRGLLFNKVSGDESTRTQLGLEAQIISVILIQ